MTSNVGMIYPFRKGVKTMANKNGKYVKRQKRIISRRNEKRKNVLLNRNHTPVIEFALTVLMLFLTLVLLIAVVSCP